MASTIGHFIVGAAIALPAMESRALRSVFPRVPPVLHRWAIPLTAGLLAAAPDLDTGLMVVFGIPPGSLFSHRGFFHSPFFLIVFTAALAAIVARNYGRRPEPAGEHGNSVAWLALVWAGSAVTHPLLDMFTNSGSGVMLLFPFSQDRLFFPWRPIQVSTVGILRFFDRAWVFPWSELPFCSAAVAAGAAGLALQKRWRRGFTRTLV